MTGAGGLAAAWLRAKGDLRQRAGSWLVLALLIGIAGAFVVVTSAGGRRTSSAYDRFLEVSEPYDVIAIAFCDDSIPPGSVECDEHQAAAAKTVGSLPEVAEVAVAHNYLLPIIKSDGSSIQPGEAQGDPCFTGNGEVDVIGSFDAKLGTSIVRRRFVEGRPANPRRPDEAVLSLASARREGIEVGDRLRVVPIEACEGPPESEWPEPIEVTVVGLHLSPGEVQPERGVYLQSLTVTPPLLEQLQGEVYLDQPGALLVQLRSGVTADQLVAAAERAGFSLEIVLPRSELDAQVRDGLRPDAFGLLLLAVLGAGAAFVVLAQAMARQLWAGASEHGSLRAIGFTSRGLARIGGLQAVVIGGAASAVTVAISVLASTTMPIGRARTIEPDPGIDVDVTAIALGAIAIAITTAAVGVMASRWIAGRTAATTSPARVSRLAGALATLGASPQAVGGARMAFERQHGARAVPLASGLGAAILGIGALLGSLTFASSLDHLLATPRLVGWNWDGMAFLGDESQVPPDDPGLERLLEDVRRLEGVSRASYGTLFPAFDEPIIQGTDEAGDSQGPWLVTFSAGPDSIEPAVVEGRAPNRADEVLLAGGLARDLDVEVDDTIELHGRSFTGEDEEGVATSQAVTVVGIGVLPVGDGSFERSLSLTFEGLRELAAHAQPHIVLFDVEDDADVDAIRRGLSALGLQIEDGPPEDIDVVELVDLDVGSADGVPSVLGALMAVLAVGVLAHLVATAVRTREHDLATMRALGMVRRQVAHVATWQATLLMLVISSVAAIGGLVAGREVWFAYAQRLGVVPEVAMPFRSVAIVLAACTLVAVTVARLACRGLHRQRAGRALRAE